VTESRPAGAGRIAVALVIAAVIVIRMLIPPVMVQTCVDSGNADTSFCTTSPADP
jgi:hypothetical protein